MGYTISREEARRRCLWRAHEDLRTHIHAYIYIYYLEDVFIQSSARIRNNTIKVLYKNAQNMVIHIIHMKIDQNKKKRKEKNEGTNRKSSILD